LYLGRQKWFLVKKISIWDARIGFSPNRFQKHFESVLRFVFIAISAYVKWLFIEHACLILCCGRSYYLVVNGVVISLCSGLVTWCGKNLELLFENTFSNLPEKRRV